MLIVILQLITAVLLITVILLQTKGTGLGTTFGGSQKMYHSKRGVEKLIFGLTIILAVAFVLLSILSISL
jgi:preprotein translocase subunit SecG